MNKVVVSHHDAAPGTIKSYTIGFVGSLILTLVAYFLVTQHVFEGWETVFAIVGLALIQLIVQLLFFLHLGRESKPRWNMLVFLFMAIIVAILVFGSLWIMNNLNYHHDHMTSPSSTNTFIIHDEGFKQK